VLYKSCREDEIRGNLPRAETPIRADKSAIAYRRNTHGVIPAKAGTSVAKQGSPLSRG
jgi:hypothetical protein